MKPLLPTTTMSSVATAFVAAAVLLGAGPAFAAMLPPCDFDTTLETIDFTSPDGEACFLCVQAAPGECSVACDGAACAASPPGCGEIACPEPYVPPPNPDGCPDVAPEMFAPCDWGEDAGAGCVYDDPYCSFACMGGETLLLCMSKEVPPPPPPPSSDCAAASSCTDCLSRDGCDAWSAGSCYPTCLEGPMDTSCWSTQYFADEGPEEICRKAEDKAADDALCSSQSDCLSCVGAETSNGGNCQWFEYGYCGNGCGMNGCGLLTCPEDGGIMHDGGMGGVGMANPASVFCEDNGGTLEIVADEDGGEYGVCIFEDGSECEEWAYMREECAPGDSLGDEAGMGGVGMPNPASVFCEDNGGTLEIITEEDGEYGVCIFEDGSQCEEWAYMREECAPGDSLGDEAGMDGVGMANPASVFCVDNGGTSEIRTEEDGGQYGVCIFEDGSECEEFAYMKEECAPGDSLGGEAGMGGVGMANPASVFCEDNGGTLEIRTEEAGGEYEEDGGEYGVCIFEDGSECEEFAYMKGECAPGDSLDDEEGGMEAPDGAKANDSRDDGASSGDTSNGSPEVGPGMDYESSGTGDAELSGEEPSSASRLLAIPCALVIGGASFMFT